MSKRPNVQKFKRPKDQMSKRSNVQKSKCPKGQKSWDQKSKEQRSKSSSVQKAKCQKGQMSRSSFVPKTKCPKVQVSKRPNVNETTCLEITGPETTSLSAPLSRRWPLKSNWPLLQIHLKEVLYFFHVFGLCYGHMLRLRSCFTIPSESSKVWVWFVG